MQVGRYQLFETLGVGATSRVVRGFDPMIGRPVAVKIFPSDIAQGEARDRFLREARVVGQLSHPNIITLHDMGIEEATQTPYLVMEFIDGGPLDRILEKGTLPLPRACAWIAQAAEALDIAHKRGVIHGDVKPANILITADGKVKITDFGMARVAKREARDSALLGTPAYWCPEQIMGRPQDARSDIFSLGVVLYELLTGTRPFDAESLQGICNRVLSSTPNAVSQLQPSVPAAFDEIVSACLAKNPESRVPSGEALAQLLYPHARRKVVLPQHAAPDRPAAPAQPSFRDRASRLLRSA
ncbi:MAG TPA: serine/threonine-protein kinase [Candidatus Eisenbacteria bacterium]|jgi:serine/threonine-protein kinase|nr:serine/threonine-protein kinase [Candidatus Eisenbacteria bacterium]